MRGPILLLSLPLAAAALAADPGATAPAATPTEVVILNHSDSPPAPSMQVRLPPFDLQTKVYDFPTGLRILFQSDRNYPVVKVYTIVNHGSSDDPPGKDEVAHFVEHTWFRSLHGSLPPIMDVVQDISGQFNATTGNDYTNYLTSANSDLLPVLLRLESLRLTEFYAGVTEEVTMTEREVIRNEMRRRDENGGAVSKLVGYVYSTVYPDNHPYHSFSSHDTIDQIHLTDLQQYIDKYYKPNETTITVVGDFDPADALSLIFENFDLKVLDPKLTPEMLYKVPRRDVVKPDPNNPAHWLTQAYDPTAFAQGKKIPFQLMPAGFIKPRVSEADRAPVPDLGDAEIAVRTAPVDKPFALLGWSLPGGYREDDLELRLLGQFAGNAIIGGLSEEWQNKLDPTFVGCEVVTEKINSTMLCFAKLKDKSADPSKLTDAMLDQVYRITEKADPNDPNGAVSLQYIQQSFARAKADFLANELLSMDSVAPVFGGRADNIGTFAHLTGDPNYYNRIFTRIGSISVTTLQDLAEKYIKRDRAARVVVKPMPEEEIDITSAESGYIAQSKSDTIVKASDDLAHMTPEMIAGSRVRPDITKLTDYTLPNGLRVVIMPHANVPLVQASLIFGGGSYNFPKGTIQFMQEFTEGTGQDPLRVAGAVDWAFFAGIPGISSATSYPTSTAVQTGNSWRMDFRGPSGNLDSALWTIRNEIDGAHPYLSETADWKKRQLKRIKSGWTDMAWHTSDMVSQFLYPDAPWQQARTWAEVQAMQDFDADTIKATLDRIVQPSNAVLLIVGNTTTEAAKDLAAKYFGGWAGAAGRADGWAGKVETPKIPTEPTRVLIFEDKDKPLGTQSQTDMMCRLNYRGEEDRAAARVLSSILGTRVFDTLRVKEALTYTPGAFAQVDDDGSATLYFDSLALNKGVGRTVEYFLAVARSIENGEFEESELTRHKLRMARGSGIGAQTIDGMTATLGAAVVRGDPWSKIDHAGDYIAGVNRDQIIRLIQGCSSHAIVTIDGLDSVVGPQLKEKGIAYEVVDWKTRGDELLKAADPKAYDKMIKERAKSEKKKKAEEAKKAAETPAAEEKKVR